MAVVLSTGFVDFVFSAEARNITEPFVTVLYSTESRCAVSCRRSSVNCDIIGFSYRYIVFYIAHIHDRVYLGSVPCIVLPLSIYCD